MIRAAAGILVLGVAVRAAADPAFDQLEARAIFGLATAPFDAMALPEAKGQALVFVLDGQIAASRRIAIDLRVPLVLASVAQPAGSYVDSRASGNPQLGARYEILDRRGPDTELVLAGGLELGAPLAGHDAALMANRALAIANGIEGLAHPELFTPGRAPITPFASGRWIAGAWTLSAAVRLPLLVRTSDAALSSMARPRSIGLAGVMLGEARREVSRRLAVAFAPQLAVDVVASTAHVRPVSRLQDLERLSLVIRIGARAHLIVDLQTALGGALGGSTFAGGVRGLVDLP